MAVTKRTAGPPNGARPLPRISDATLRDSAHMAGVEFGPADGRIAGLLVRSGVELVEVGMISGPASKDAPSSTPPMTRSAPNAASAWLWSATGARARAPWTRPCASGCGR